MAAASRSLSTARLGHPPGPKQVSTEKPRISEDILSINRFFASFTSWMPTRFPPFSVIYASTFNLTFLRTKKGTFFNAAFASPDHSIKNLRFLFSKQNHTNRLHGKYWKIFCVHSFYFTLTYIKSKAYLNTIYPEETIPFINFIIFILYF